MKISKRTLECFFERGTEHHQYIQECLKKEFNYDFENDEVYKLNWSLYYNDLRKKFDYFIGDLIYALIQYAIQSELNADNVEAALRGMDI